MSIATAIILEAVEAGAGNSAENAPKWESSSAEGQENPCVIQGHLYPCQCS